MLKYFNGKVKKEDPSCMLEPTFMASNAWWDISIWTKVVNWPSHPNSLFMPTSDVMTKMLILLFVSLLMVYGSAGCRGGRKKVESFGKLLEKHERRSRCCFLSADRSIRTSRAEHINLSSTDMDRRSHTVAQTCNDNTVWFVLFRPQNAVKGDEILTFVMPLVQLHNQEYICKLS